MSPPNLIPTRLNQRRGASAGRKSKVCSVQRVFFFLAFATLLPALLVMHLYYYPKISDLSNQPMSHAVLDQPHNQPIDQESKQNEEIIASSPGGASQPEVVDLSSSSGIPAETMQAYNALLVEKNDGKPLSSRPIQVAYAISLIRCSDFQSSTSGLIDAATVLRHSVHQTSVRNPGSGSMFDYKMYAIVHSSATSCSSILEDLGYTVLVRDPPIKAEEIQGDYLRKNVHKEWCCGSDEFVKLFAYTLTDHPIVVHTDIDFMFLKPMDELFHSILKSSRKAWGAIQREYPEKTMPDTIDAFLTRDYHQVMPGRKPLFQAGFIVLRPSMETFQEYVDIIREGDYVEGYSQENGWGGKGYGGLVGAMAMQGLPAYYYDIIRPNTTVELNGCRYNHMGADVLYRDVPNFYPKKYADKIGACRRNVEGCEDCQLTKVSLIKNIHFTNCRKPWNCAGIGEDEGGKRSGKKGQYIDTRTANYEHCMKVVRKWHEMRFDLEQKLFTATGDASVFDGQQGTYKKEVFMGHCEGEGQSGYRPISASKDALRQASEKIWLEGRDLVRFNTISW